MKSTVLLLSALFALLVSSWMVRAEEFIAGADMSHLAFFEDRGTVYKSGGQIEDALAILTGLGVNCVRLRLFTSSAAQAQADPYNYTNNLAYVLPLAARVKNQGLKLLLDFHFSDTWADPGHQLKPALWSALSFAELKIQMRGYTSNTIASLDGAGALPDYVQIGNEITQGLLWYDGNVGGTNDNSTQWSKLAQLMTNAIQGVKDASGANMPKVIVHIDRGADWASTQWYFGNLIANHVPFDIIGESYYPWIHGYLASLRNCLTNAATLYGKPVMVMETDFPRANSADIYGIPASTNGQVQFVAELAKIVKGVPGGRGAGVFWWAAEYQQLSDYGLAGFDQRSLFGNGGEVLPAAAALGALAAPLKLAPALTNGLLNLSWPLSGAGMVLQSCSNLNQAGWSNVTNMIQRVGTAFSTSLPLNVTGSAFYRLRSN